MKKLFKKILLCIDNSPLSTHVADAALSLARQFDAAVVGIHGYNASIHEGAFRMMEPTLPVEYQQEEILQKQRQLHRSLINTGMEKISLSYLKPVEELFNNTFPHFQARVREGKNFSAVNNLIMEEGGDLVVMGTSGFNHESKGFIGSVCLRALRGVNQNFLLIRKHLGLQRPVFMVGLDGSASAVNALKAAAELAAVFDGDIHLVYIFDSEIHKDIFGRLKESLINQGGFSFNAKAQAKIHDEFIDKGLARVGAMILDKAEQDVFGATDRDPARTAGWGLMGEGAQARRFKKILDGHIYKKICNYAEEVKADLVFIGRTGRHFTEGLDLGSVAENVARYAPCSVFVAQSADKGLVNL